MCKAIVRALVSPSEWNCGGPVDSQWPRGSQYRIIQGIRNKHRELDIPIIRANCHTNT